MTVVAPATTTPDAIRLDMIAVLKGITPNTHPSEKWTYCENPEDVGAGGKLRRFHIMNEPAAPDEDGFAGAGMTFAYDMAVLASYGDLQPAEDDSLISEDGLQLFVEFIQRQDPVFGGFDYIEHFPDRREDGADDEGFITTSHIFRVHYHAQTIAS